jgi:cytochrome P450
MMLGERVRQSMENPPVRVASRRMVQQGFTKDAMGGYIDKVCMCCRGTLTKGSSGERGG